MTLHNAQKEKRWRVAFGIGSANALSVSSMASGLVFNIQKYSVHDGPGIRTTVFLKGCPLSCPWCHNPEGISCECEMIVIETRCAGCGACRRVCPFGQVVPGTGALPAKHDTCTLCGECVQTCPTGARQIAGRRMTVGDVMAEVVRDRVFYEDSGGGVTFSGGEPFHQSKFLLALLEASRVAELNVAVDTCGFVCTKTLLEAARFTDLFLYDLKMIDDAKHRRYTGVSNSLILENLRALSRAGASVWLRIPIIPDVNDSDTDLEAAIGFAATLGSVRQINLLPYHATGLHKSRHLARNPGFVASRSVTLDQLARAVRRFESLGVPVVIGG